MHIAISGSSGLIGSAVVPLLTSGGHQVTRIVRGQAAPGEVQWEPTSGRLDVEGLSGVEAVIHLAGENIAARRWTEAFKSRIRESRVDATKRLCRSLAGMTDPPRTFVSASAVGYYGDRGDERLDEDAAPGRGFLPEVAEAWEAATEPARAAGMRVARMRFGVVLSPRGGALAKMLTPFRMGGGGVVGNGRQYWSWVSLDDAAGALHHALVAESLAGPVNVVAPNPVTNAEFTTTLARVLRRPAIVPLPAFAVRLGFGEMGEALLLSSARAVPQRLLESGYVFQQPTLETALRHLLGRSTARSDQARPA